MTAHLEATNRSETDAPPVAENPMMGGVEPSRGSVPAPKPENAGVARTARGMELLRRVRWGYAMAIVPMFALNAWLYFQDPLAGYNPFVAASALVALLAIAWFPTTGAIVAILSILIALMFRADSYSLLLLPVAAIALSLKPWTPCRRILLALMGVLALLDAAQYAAPGKVVINAVVALLSVAFGLLIGKGLAYGVTSIGDAEAAIEQTSRTPDDVRREERSHLAGELVSLLETDLTTLAQPTPKSQQTVAGLRQALEAAVDTAQASLQNLRALVSTLRGTEPIISESAVPFSLREALEEVEEELVGHGYAVELEVPPFAELPRGHASMLASLAREAAHNVVAHARPGSMVWLAVGATSETVTLTIANELLTDAPAPLGTGLRALAERISLAGGTLSVGPRSDKWVLSATLPLRPHRLGAANEVEPSRSWRLANWLASQRKWLITAAGVLLLAMQGITLGTVLAGQPSISALRGAFLGILATGALILTVWWRRAGFVVVLCLAVVIMFSGADFAADAWLLTAAVVHLILRSRNRNVRLGIAVLAGYVIVRMFTQPEPLRGALALLELLLPVLTITVIAATIVLVMDRMQLELEQLKAAQRAIRLRERQSLAGELHDVLAHHLSLIVMEAEMHLGSHDRGELTRALDSVTAHNQAALVDLSMLTFILREGEDGLADPTPNEHGPTRSAAGLEAAISEHGFTHSAEVDPELDHLDRTIQRTVVRILRESVTNALRYAKEGSHIDLRATAEPSGVVVEVTSDLGDCTKDRSGLSTGSGLNGLGQRVSLLGGEFEAGPRGHHWVVNAKLPFELRPEALAS